MHQRREDRAADHQLKDRKSSRSELAPESYGMPHMHEVGLHPAFVEPFIGDRDRPSSSILCWQNNGL